MRNWRASRRGLSEIVGTLMLVVIVVAAATLLSAFVAAYEKQVLSQEAQQHLRSLERLRVTSIRLIPNPTNLNESNSVLVTFVSGDPHEMNLTSYLSGAISANSWNFSGSFGTTQCTQAAVNGTEPVVNFDKCALISSFGTVTVGLVFPTVNFNASHTVELTVYSFLADEFRFSFFDPVPIVKTTLEPVGVKSEPLFDGSTSYVPVGGDNASIVSWSWVFIDTSNMTSSPKNWSYSGPQIEVYQLSSIPSPGYSYLVTLTVSDSDGLSASTSVVYLT